MAHNIFALGIRTAVGASICQSSTKVDCNTAFVHFKNNILTSPIALKKIPTIPGRNFLILLSLIAGTNRILMRNSGTVTSGIIFQCHDKFIFLAVNFTMPGIVTGSWIVG